MPSCDVALERHETIRGITKMEQQHYKEMKHYVACKKMHLVTNLAVPELNLACLREMKQQLNDKVEHSTIYPTTCWLTHPSSWQLHFS
jgi:hypothetical protein